MLLTPILVRAAWSDARGSYNYYQVRGNKEAMTADFKTAIADWGHAAVLSTDPDKSCRGELQRVQIRAAKEAQTQMLTGHLTNAQAAAWFEKRNSELWIPNKCNAP
jgi:hypothetical protein